MVTPDACAPHGGTFHGLGSTCEGRNCSVGGACHGPTTKSTCEFHRGTFSGYGTTCARLSCTP